MLFHELLRRIEVSYLTRIQRCHLAQQSHSWWPTNKSMRCHIASPHSISSELGPSMTTTSRFAFYCSRGRLSTGHFAISFRTARSNAWPPILSSAESTARTTSLAQRPLLGSADCVHGRQCRLSFRVFQEARSRRDYATVALY